MQKSWLAENSLMKEKSLLVENFLDECKILACEKIYLIKEKSFFVENFLDEKKSLLVEKIFDRGKIMALSL